MNATNLNITTASISSATIRSDRGCGTVTLNLTNNSWFTDSTNSNFNLN